MGAGRHKAGAEPARSEGDCLVKIIVTNEKCTRNECARREITHWEARDLRTRIALPTTGLHYTLINYYHNETIIAELEVNMFILEERKNKSLWRIYFIF